jgi:hypothetical protein
VVVALSRSLGVVEREHAPLTASAPRLRAQQCF